MACYNVLSFYELCTSPKGFLSHPHCCARRGFTARRLPPSYSGGGAAVYTSISSTTQHGKTLLRYGILSLEPVQKADCGRETYQEGKDVPVTSSVLSFFFRMSAVHSECLLCTRKKKHVSLSVYISSFPEINRCISYPAPLSS